MTPSTSMDAAAGASRSVAWWKWLVAVAGIATFIALLLTAQQYASNVAERLPFDWGQELRRQLAFWHTRALLAPFVIAFAERFRIDRDNWLRRVPAWLVAMAVFGAAQSALLLLLDFNVPWLSEPPPPPDPMPSFWFAVWVRLNATAAANVLFFIAIAVAYHAVDYYRAWRARELAAAQLEAMLARSELALLRMQLHPHFLFNALHTVAALMGEDVQAARRVVMRLGDLLRLSLDRMSAAEVSLDEELEFARAYLDIQETRFRDRLAVSISADPDARRALVPSLILQPLVENAVRHAAEPSPHPTRLEITAARENGMLRLVVRDTGPGLRASDVPPADDAARPRLGLRNTRQRLERMYSAAHRFETRDAAGGGVEAIIELPYHETPQGASAHESAEHAQ